MTSELPNNNNPSVVSSISLSLVPIPCTMCTKQEPSICSCKTCIHYLCKGCNFAHKSMVCFQNHEVVLIEDDDSGIKQYLKNNNNNNNNEYINNNNINNHRREDRSETSDKLSSETEDLSPYSKAQIQRMYSMGQKQLERLLNLMSEVQQSLNVLGKYRLTVIGEVNEIHQQFQEHLKNQRDAIMNNLDEHLSEKQSFLLTLKHETRENVNGLLSQLATYKSLISDDPINGDACSSEPDSAIGVDSGVFNSFQSLDLNSINYSPGHLEDSLPLNQDLNNTCSLNLPLPALISTNSEISLAMSDSCSVSCTKKRVNSIEIYKIFGQKGNGLGLLNSPHGFCLGFNEDVVVADTSNHRVQVFTKSGELRYEFGIAGRHDGHLWHPRKVVLLPKKKEFVVCDRGYERSRMQIFSEEGKFIKKIYIQYIDIVSGVTINDKENIVVVDSVTPTIFILGDNEYLRSIDCSHFMEEPSDIAILEKNYYICDFKAHNICVVSEDGVLIRKLGNKQITTFPNGIDILPFGYILIGDSHGNFFHISVYTKDGEYVSDFRCPHIKVSRCCGLKITKDGNLVTVDKNYHHVIMLENIYPHLGI